ncbi:MAG: hypothetical protein GY771_00165, partial [bacterium]|nr:hypothetical protein [bacterium]
MSYKLKAAIIPAIASVFVASFVLVGQIGEAEAGSTDTAYASADATTKKCIDCHQKEGIAENWNNHWAQSKHGQNGIGCMACHKANEGEPDAWNHEGFLVTHIPTPKDCGICHSREYKEFTDSHHASAGKFVGSLDNYLGEVVEGHPSANLGCKQCHGSKVEIDADGVPVAGSWPNTGIGRLNPDGSNGTCTACHTRHLFSKKQAREPATCGRCHMGPDHPQIEIYEESKHGVNFAAYRDEMNLDADEWVLGKDYSAAPTCSTCHMGATDSLGITHDIGDRISWTLRPKVSKKVDNWEKKRDDMQSVCMECHGPTWVKSFYAQYDDAINLYNDKYGTPSVAIMGKLKDAGVITPTPFDDEIEWTFFELWQHEGRRARMGAAMMGPDYTHWHGTYDIAKTFYTHYIPELRKMVEKGLKSEDPK